MGRAEQNRTAPGKTQHTTYQHITHARTALKKIITLIKCPNEGTINNCKLLMISLYISNVNKVIELHNKSSKSNEF